MEENIKIWLVGNTGLRNPNRIQEGLSVYAKSAFVGKLHGRDNEIGFILASIAKYPYLSAKISPSCVVNPRRATARLAVYSLSDKILSRNLLDILQ